MLDIFFFNDTATTEIYTLSLHDALPIWDAHEYTPSRTGCQPLMSPVPRTTRYAPRDSRLAPVSAPRPRSSASPCRDLKSTRLNSSHANISYAVFCLKKKNTFYSISVPHY